MKLDMRRLTPIPNDEGWYYVPNKEYAELFRATVYLHGCTPHGGDAIYMTIDRAKGELEEDAMVMYYDPDGDSFKQQWQVYLPNFRHMLGEIDARIQEEVKNG